MQETIFIPIDCCVESRIARALVVFEGILSPFPLKKPNSEV